MSNWVEFLSPKIKLVILIFIFYIYVFFHIKTKSLDIRVTRFPFLPVAAVMRATLRKTGGMPWCGCQLTRELQQAVVISF